MIMEQKFLSKLKAFGLNTYDAKIWTSLLARGVSTAGELADISNVPRSRAYDVLESLEKKGFIVMKIGKPIKYIAVQPEEVIERVKKRVTDDAQKQADMIDELKKDVVLRELEVLYNNGIDVVDTVELTGAPKDRTNLYHNLNMMINNAEETIMLMTTAKGLTRKAESLKRSLERAKRRGVTIRILAPLNKDSQGAVELLKPIADIRNIDDVKARFCIVDNKQITFALMDDEKAVPSYDVGIWVNTEFFATAVSNMFDGVWKKVE